MAKKTAEIIEEKTGIVRVDDTTIDENQLSEQLYNSAGLDPIVSAGIKDYEHKIQVENKIINKIFGIRESDIKGYGESVAKRVALAIYTLLNKQYGGKVGDMRSYIMSLEEERDRANTRYDDLMGRVIGILGDEYKELRTDSVAFIEKLTRTLGDDLKESKIDQKALAESLADIDGLRAQIVNLNGEKVKITEKFEAQIAELKSEHKEETRGLQLKIDKLNEEQVQLQKKHELQMAELIGEHREEIRNLKSQIETLDLNIKGLESEKTAIVSELEQLKNSYSALKKSLSTMVEAIPNEGIGKNLSDKQYDFLLEDSRVPSAVIKGVSQFIDFKKYLGLAGDGGAREIGRRIEALLKAESKE